MTKSFASLFKCCGLHGGAGVRWTSLGSRSTDRADRRDSVPLVAVRRQRNTLGGAGAKAITYLQLNNTPRADYSADFVRRKKMKKTKEKVQKVTSIGGQALMEGIMMRGPLKTTVGVRKNDGSIELQEIQPLNLTKKYKILRIPILRGVANMIDSLVTGNKALLLSADKAMEGEEVPEEELSKFDKWMNKHFGEKAVSVIMGAAMVFAIIFCVGVFFFVPVLLYNLLSEAVPFLKPQEVLDEAGNVVKSFIDVTIIWRSAFEGIIRIILFLVYMGLVSMNKDIKRVFQYHGAEHKTIFCYEHGLELNVENVRKQRRFHPRCGTSFIVLMLIVGIIMGMFIPFTNTLLRSSLKILLLPITIGIGYELIKLCGKHDNIITRIIAAPGVWMQHITTKEPEDKMIEVAIEAMKDVIPENGEDIIR